MKTVKAGSPCVLYELAPGVRGYAIQRGEDVYVPMIEATEPGGGDVGRFLDSLPGSFRCAKIPNIISGILRGMLERRGFRLMFERADDGEIVDVWCKWQKEPLPCMSPEEGE